MRSSLAVCAVGLLASPALADPGIPAFWVCGADAAEVNGLYDRCDQITFSYVGGRRNRCAAALLLRASAVQLIHMPLPLLHPLRARKQGSTARAAV
jgi:hypothetical protein